ncbi:carbohydrate porin [Novosphingobium sp. KCTC 2891]|uniref:carbohydrate porin n=1 Tax=Novosphingobium sp. KCTC 2891 TaxID=2989730 RepID=UPI002221F8A5|nr:carbohydrate porin [Novosphingobium sp. KCTC 2891]MCW1384951.1 carbohydrate porin [Novosphingobium sp. KCTC 2891]
MLRRPILTGILCALTTGISPSHAHEAALSVGGSYVADILAVADGGARRGSAWLARADVWADLDGAALSLPGVTFHADLVATHGPDLSGSRVGDFQTVSNVQADTVPHLYEAWAEWQLAPGLAAKAGLVDLNSEFDVQEVGALFLNSAHGIGPEFSQSGVNGPSIFPMMASAVIARIGGGQGPQVRLGLFDAVAGSRNDPRRTALRLPGQTGALVVGEIELPLGKGEVQLGAWHYSRRQEALTPGQPRAPSRGAYVMVEGPLKEHLSGWVRIGTADGRANPVTSYLGAGMVLDWRGWQLGTAVAHARAGSAARRTLLPAGKAASAETAIEWTAAHNLTAWMSVQPDVQYVINPGWDPALPDALVVGMRISLGWPAG